MGRDRGRPPEGGDMTSLLDELLADLKAEGAQLWNVVCGLDDDGWLIPTPAAGWTVATQIAHLVWTDEVAVIAATDIGGWDALVRAATEDPTGYIDKQALEIARLPPEALIARW